MPDHGRRYADRKIKKVDRELQGIYRQAEKELTKKLADFVANSKEQDRLKQKQRDAGLITEEEYQSWLKGQVFQKKRWEAKIKQVQQVMYNHNVEAAKIVHENKMDVFAENYNYQAFMTEGITGVSFDIYDTDAVAMLIKDRPDLLPEWKIDEEKDYDWNYRKVNNAITQGIIQGESVDKVMRRLCDNLSTQNENKMRMFARTAINEAESAGRQKQMEDSAKKGIRIEKEWLATLDSRTRDTHRHLDGQRKPYNEPFKSDLGDIMFPCDPKADPANVYNCRCTTIPVYPDYEDEQDNWRENETIDGMTYQEWKTAKDRKTTGKPRSLKELIESEPLENPLETIKRKIKEHNGEWNVNDLQEIGTKTAEMIDKRIADNPPPIEYSKEIETVEEELKALYESYEEKRKEYGRTYDSSARIELNKLATEYQEKFEKRNRLVQESSEYHSKITGAVIGEIREIGGVTKATRSTYMTTKTGKTADALETAMNYYPSTWLGHSASNSVALKPKWTNGRACYKPGLGEILLDGTLGTGIHELAHRFERCVPGLLQAEKEFYEKRTAGEPLKWLGKGYGNSEKTRRDNFVEPYMGKDYGNTAFELASVGFELAYTQYDKLSRDKDMLNWVLGLLAAL